MRGKKLGSALVLAAFVAVLCLPWPLWALVSRRGASANHENRELAALPEFTAANYANLPGQLEDYVNDHLPFRDRLVALQSEIDYFLFRTPSNRNVLLGRDDWLFYNDPTDGDPLRSYRGGDLLPEETLAAAAQNLVAQRDFLAAQGKRLVLFIIPNKERVYCEYMPRWVGPPAEQYRARQVVEYLRANTDLTVVWPYEAMLAAKERLPERLYFATDTHWNGVGAYVGAGELLKALDVALPQLGDGAAVLDKGETAGDLAGMLNLTERLKFADRAYEVTGFDTHGFEVLENGVKGAAILRSQGADPRRIYFVRDSFSDYLLDYVGAQFNDSCFRHIDSFTPEDCAAWDPDIVVIESVERYLDRFLFVSFQ